ncbi:hypothetical protein LXL04_035360 [Taraxacum kok-saghyz]
MYGIDVNMTLCSIGDLYAKYEGLVCDVVMKVWGKISQYWNVPFLDHLCQEILQWNKKKNASEDANVVEKTKLAPTIEIIAMFRSCTFL